MVFFISLLVSLKDTHCLNIKISITVITLQGRSRVIEGLLNKICVEWTGYLQGSCNLIEQTVQNAGA